MAILYPAKNSPGHKATATLQHPNKLKPQQVAKILNVSLPFVYKLAAQGQVIQSSEVIIVEGEKDADNLSKLKVTATTNPMGAGKWKEEYSEHLKDKNVVLLPDNDDVGRKHMEQVAKSLECIAASIKLIELPDLPAGGDVSDFINRFDDPETAAERLAILIDQAGPWKPSEKPNGIDGILSIARNDAQTPYYGG